MPRNIARKSETSPASQTRPKLVTTRPSPMDDPMPDAHAAIDAARLADEYDAIRIKLDEFEREKEMIEARLVAAMRSSGKKNFNTMHGRVSLLEATESRQIPDEKGAVALLEKHGIPQPPTMEAWLAQHRLTVPTKEKAGLPDRIKFEMNK